MATPKQIELRVKYAKTSINSLSKKINLYKNKIKKLEDEMKKAKCAAKPAAKKAPAKKKAKKK
jgi:hypothetical protein